MRKLDRWLPALFIAAVIFGLSSLHGTTVRSVGITEDAQNINLHFVFYFALAVSMFRGIKNAKHAAILVALYSLLDEIHQTFVPGRAFQVLDLFVDNLASVVALTIIWKFYSKLPKTLKNWLEK